MNSEMSTTKENIIWEEKNLIEPMKKLENNGESDVCGIIINTNEKLKKKILKDTTKIRGIYKIINKINGKYYIGSSENIKKRWNVHKMLLNKNKHPNIYLQNSWNKYGKDNFDFITIEKVESHNLLIIEQKYLDICKNDKKSYNISFSSTSPMLGRNHTLETKLEMSQNRSGHNHPLFGKHHTCETREKIKISNTRPYEEIYGIQKSKEIRKNKSILWKGKNNPMYNKHHTLEAKQKMSNYRIGKKHSDETKEKIGKYFRDKTIFALKNTKTHEMFIGTKHEFIVKYYNGLRNYSIYCIFTKNKPYKGWKLNPSM